MKILIKQYRNILISINRIKYKFHNDYSSGYYNLRRKSPSRKFDKVDHHTMNRRTALNLKREKKSEQNHVLSERKNKRKLTKLSIEEIENIL